MMPRPEPARACSGSTDDWRHFAEHHWAREPVVVPHGPPSGLDAEGAHRLLVAAAHSPGVARVRLAASDGVLREPGRLLPAPADRDTAGYAARLAASDQLAGSGWLLTVRDGLHLDFALWSRVRDAVAGLWRHVGWPALPVTAELAVGARHHSTEEFGTRPDTAALTWVLDGSLTLRVRPEHTGTEFELHAGRGDLVHWPAGSTHLDDRTARCTTLRLAVPSRTTSALPLVGDVLGELLRRDPAARDEEPAVDHPAPTAPDGRLVPPHPYAEPVERYATLLDGDGPESALLLRWAALRSAAGLAPAPEPRPPVALTPHHRLARTTGILHIADRDGSTVWAAHGHARRSAHPAARAVLARLRATPGTTVTALARSCGSAPDSPELLALLGELYEVRAVEATAPERRP